MTKDSRTQEALKLMREEGITAYAAAKRVVPPLTTTTVHNAWRKSQGICPCCGKPLEAVSRLSLAIDALDKAIAKGERITVDDVVAYLKQMRGG